MSAVVRGRPRMPKADRALVRGALDLMMETPDDEGTLSRASWGAKCRQVDRILAYLGEGPSGFTSDDWLSSAERAIRLADLL